MKPPAILGSAVVALGVAAGALLDPQSASAIDFTFSFGFSGGVSGLITGLVDGLNPCDDANVCQVIVEAPGASAAPTGLYTFESGTGFLVQGGSILKADWKGRLSLPLSLPGTLTFTTLSSGLDGVLSSTQAVDFGLVSFTHSSRLPAVPGPLPLLGAAAALGYSRKLRKRIKGSTTTAPFA